MDRKESYNCYRWSGGRKLAPIGGPGILEDIPPAVTWPMEGAGKPWRFESDVLGDGDGDGDSERLVGAEPGGVGSAGRVPKPPCILKMIRRVTKPHRFMKEVTPSMDSFPAGSAGSLGK